MTSFDTGYLLSVVTTAYNVHQSRRGLFSQSTQAVTVLLFHPSSSLCLLASRAQGKENDTAESDKVLFKTSDFAFGCYPHFFLPPLLHLSTYQDEGRKNEKEEV